ncbi:DUF1028 domain-containing protein [Sulfitobacter sp. F26204]|uniref:DUF1028 domain-containing protein n=1 Tax=Sulfitobacter sp. F26204 TaxID=2996014 RepID=UPI00225E2E84|nr:DUF1028 domain-containing protein [Sulfitobacter sp. F26204]MCX7560669.1 DUF1028 domain-containing protein [Sulfitobacter sp. F26204]
MTYSIVAKDPETGAVGIAVASRFFAVGAMVPHVSATHAVASQAWVNPLWGTQGLAQMQAGKSAQSVLDGFLSRDSGQASRQCHMIDPEGGFAAHTGRDCIDWAGHEIGDRFSVAGNMLAGPQVITAMANAFRQANNEPFESRMLTALEAGETAGGDKRGRQSAGMVIHRGEDYAWLDIRADDHADPLGELRRLLAVARERYLLIADDLPTSAAFSGLPDRDDLDARIAAADARRKAEGRASASHAPEPFA